MRNRRGSALPYLGLQTILWLVGFVPFDRGRLLLRLLLRLLRKRFQNWLGRLFYECFFFGAELRWVDRRREGLSLFGAVYFPQDGDTDDLIPSRGVLSERECVVEGIGLGDFALAQEGERGDVAGGALVGGSFMRFEGDLSGLGYIFPSEELLVGEPPAGHG